jgi:phosphoglycolate phosphatase
VYPGIPELLAKLRADGRRLAVATSKPTVFAERILEHFDLAKHFELVVGSFLDGRRVEKHEVVAAALEGVAGVTARDVVMVGDRRHDIEGARANGIDAIAAAWGYGSEDELRRAQPTLVASSVDELGRLLLLL